MELTGKCKEDFKNWILDTGQGEINYGELCYSFGNWFRGWDRIPDSMKWGVYLDFFEISGIDLKSSPSKYRSLAIEKGNEIYNSK